MTRDEILDKKVVYVKESDRFGDDFSHPSKHFIVNAFGDALYFKTRSRATAQEWADIVYGKGFYKVRAAIKASVS